MNRNEDLEWVWLTFSRATKAGGRESGNGCSRNLSLQIDGLVVIVEGWGDTGAGSEGEREGGRDIPIGLPGWKRGGEDCSKAFDGTGISVGAHRS